MSSNEAARKILADIVRESLRVIPEGDLYNHGKIAALIEFGEKLAGQIANGEFGS